MKLNKSQTQAIANKIYNNVSQTIESHNQKIIDKYIKNIKVLYEQDNKLINEIQEHTRHVNNKLNFPGLSCTYYHPYLNPKSDSRLEQFARIQAQKDKNFKKLPSKLEIFDLVTIGTIEFDELEKLITSIEKQLI